MAKSISDNTKKRGRPATTGTGTLVGVRLLPDLIDPLDHAGAELGEKTRPEAIRHILRDWLKRAGYLDSSKD